jgi:acetoacetyl-CoA synthetase
MDKPLWSPTERFAADSNLKAYMLWLEREHKLSFLDYDALWRWSVREVATFWESLWDYFDIVHDGSYSEVFKGEMPKTKWFEGTRLNYAEHIFRNYSAEENALIFKAENRAMQWIQWHEVYEKVAAFQHYLKSLGLEPGDRVVAYLPNIPEASIAFLACAASGIVWSSCSPDFGTESVIDRFLQIEPKVLLAVNGYSYGGKLFDRTGIVQEIENKIPSVETVVMVDYIKAGIPESYASWHQAVEADGQQLTFERLAFDHPIWVLYSSGTTGMPKAITHGHGGVLLEHLKYTTFHNDVKPGENFFWYSTTGWMMWNMVQASLLAGATAVLYDGSPGFPDLAELWRFAEKAPIHHFGTSAAFLHACLKDNLDLRDFELENLRSIGSTGSPLSPEGFDYVYEKIKKDICLWSMAGGTDVCTAFVGGNPFLPIYRGEIQCRALGCDLHAWNEEGDPVLNEVGEMVITAPMPSMPIYFWNDPNLEKYTASYFEMYPGVWRHGDWININDHGGLVISGRSDATLNRQGVRIGTAEIYRALLHVDELQDSMIVNLKMRDRDDFMPLFVRLKNDTTLDDDLRAKIKKTLKSHCSPRHVPDDIIQVPDIPYTISGKKMEAPIKKLLMGMDQEKSINVGAMRNPECLDFYLEFAAGISS